MRLLRCAVVCAFFLGWSANAAGDLAENIRALLEPIRAKHDAPALAAGASIGGKIVALGATGVRKLGSPEAVTENDLWHIGSCTKSMTAALLVKEKKIRWGLRSPSCFPSCAPRASPPL